MRQDSTVARALAAEYLLDPRGLSPRVVIDELMSTLAARDAEIERLRDKALRFDLDQLGIEQREKDAIELVEARAEIERLKALVEKRERQLVWAIGNLTAVSNYAVSQPRLWVEDEEYYFDGTDTGLLAAIDEATEEK